MAKKDKIETVSVRSSSTPSVVKDLTVWLRECLFLAIEDEEETPRLARIVVRQLLKGNKRGEEVLCLDVPKKAGEEWPESASFELYSKLQVQTANLGGLQKYGLYAYHTGNLENHTSRYVIRIQGVNDEDDSDSLDSEEPNKTGLTSQAMRHAEVYAKTMSGMMMSLTGTFQNTIARQNQMIERLFDEKIQNMDAMQQLMDEKEERDLRMVTAKAKAGGIESLVSKLGLLLPAVANKVSGQAIFPVQDSTVSMMTRGLLTSLACDENRMKQLVALMTTEETIAFTNLLEAVSAKFDENGMPVKKTG